MGRLREISKALQNIINPPVVEEQSLPGANYLGDQVDLIAAADQNKRAIDTFNQQSPQLLRAQEKSRADGSV